MNTTELIDKIKSGKADEMMNALYGEDAIDVQKERYISAITAFEERYGGDREVSAYSVAGRTEISGNHTDHNNGCVLAASINLDIIAIAAKRDDNIICVKSEGFGEDSVDFSVYNSPRKDKFFTSESIIAGICAGFKKNGYKIGGFDAYTTSDVLKGSGLSSSAAFEVMIGNILNYLYNDGIVDNIEVAKLSQFSENEFFGKPCGLMDQIACAAGGIVSIDFCNPSAPFIEKMNFDLSRAGYNLCIVNTGGNHADLGEDYASVPAEMKAVAAALGKSVLRDVCENDFIHAVPTLRHKLGDRAILRAFHYFEENKRVIAQKRALELRDIDAFFKCVLDSGRSSFCYLQNVYTTKNLTQQGLSLALCLAEKYLEGRRAAFRVHGGGFAGTIQAFVAAEEADGFRHYMDSAFGDGSCLILRVRPFGAVKVI